MKKLKDNKLVICNNYGMLDHLVSMIPDYILKDGNVIELINILTNKMKLLDAIEENKEKLKIELHDYELECSWTGFVNNYATHFDEYMLIKEMMENEKNYWWWK